MPKPPAFEEKDRIKMLLWSDRRCCLCKKLCATDIEIAYIQENAGNDIENGFPLCMKCATEIARYNKKSAKENKYKTEELKARREQVYEEFTRQLVPPIQFYLDQRQIEGNSSLKLPLIGFRLQHLGDSLPVSVRVEAKVVYDGKDLGIVDDARGLFSGRTNWNINPRTMTNGVFRVPLENVAEWDKELQVEVRVTIIDQLKREHKLLPQCFRYIKNGEFWSLEPHSITEWK